MRRKTCTQCGEEKCIRCFNKRPNGSHKSWCKSCCALDTNSRRACAKTRVIQRVTDRTVKVLKGIERAGEPLEMLGCSAEYFLKYLEWQFEDGMSWDNYGDWSVDHCRPIASYDLHDPIDQLMCFHFSNLQPLWATENSSKGAKY